MYFLYVVLLFIGAASLLKQYGVARVALLDRRGGCRAVAYLLEKLFRVRAARELRQNARFPQPRLAQLRAEPPIGLALQRALRVEQVGHARHVPGGGAPGRFGEESCFVEAVALPLLEPF